MPRHGLVSMAKNHTHHIKGLENIYPQSSHLLLCQIVSCDYWSSLGQGIIVDNAFGASRNMFGTLVSMFCRLSLSWRDLSLLMFPWLLRVRSSDSFSLWSFGFSKCSPNISTWSFASSFTFALEKRIANFLVRSFNCWDSADGSIDSVIGFKDGEQVEWCGAMFCFKFLFFVENNSWRNLRKELPVAGMLLRFAMTGVNNWTLLAQN